MENYNNTFFFTATVLNWNHLLIDKYKDFIINTLDFLIKENRIKVFSFVIMPNHIHIIWYMNPLFTKNQIQGSLLRYSSKLILKDLKENNPDFLEYFRVDLKDRTYQIWQRNPLSIEISDDYMFQQKLEYIHNNPISDKWKLSDSTDQYKYSSAKYFESNEDHFKIISNPYLE
jgi:REP element-mobilizing transposase RayT